MTLTRWLPAGRRCGAMIGAALAVGLTVSACAHGPSTATAPSTAAGHRSSTPAASVPASPDPTSTVPSATGSPTTEASSPTSTASRPPSTPAPSKPAQPAAVLKPGSQGDKVRELQHRLVQIGWYSGSITGHYDTTTVTDVKGFQGKRGLPATGAVDATTWSRLTDMTRTPTHDEMYNVLRPGKALYKNGSQGSTVKQLQARLKQIGWFEEKITGYYGSETTASIKGFQAKREIPVTGEVDQRTWDRLVAMTHAPTAAELSGKQNDTGSTAGLDPRCLTGRAVCISKSTDQLVWVVDGKPQLRMDVRFGALASPTREGVFHVGWKAKDWVSTIYDSPMPFSMFFSGGQAVHYSSDFAARGYAGASHGCVNVRNYDGIKWLFGQVRVGDKVVVYR